MDIDEFWKLISLVDQEALEECDDEESVETLISVLSAKTEEDIAQFQEHLTKALYAIDGQKWMEQAGDSCDSGDGFLYARCYVVAKGREYYSLVLSNPNEMPKRCEQWAESLLYVSGQAWSEITGCDEEDFDREASVSYESFSNEAQW